MEVDDSTSPSSSASSELLTGSAPNSSNSSALATPQPVSVETQEEEVGKIAAATPQVLEEDPLEIEHFPARSAAASVESESCPEPAVDLR